MNTINITSKAQEEVSYEFLFKGGRLQVVEVIGPGIERKFYTRTPRQHELELSPQKFKEIAYNICKCDAQDIAELKENLKNDLEFFKILQLEIANMLDKYKELLIM